MQLSRRRWMSKEEENKKKKKEEKEEEGSANGYDTWRRGGTCLGRWPLRPTGMRLLLLAALLSGSKVASLTTGNASRDRVPKVRELQAPEIVDPREEKVELICNYELQDKELYSLSWYRNGEMLFKYIPSLETKGVFYEQPDEPDVRVSLELSNRQRLVLLGSQDIRKNMRAYEGIYFCEVTIEKPFRSDYASANITTAILPNDNPVLDGLEPNYNIGEYLDASCTSAPSLPPAELTFYLNGQQIDKTWTQKEKTLHSVGKDTLISRVSISLKLENHHFHNGSLTLVCQATLPGIPIKRIYRTEKKAIQGASNQRLAQDPPKVSSSSSGLGPGPKIHFVLELGVALGLVRRLLRESY